MTLICRFIVLIGLIASCSGIAVGQETPSIVPDEGDVGEDTREYIAGSLFSITDEIDSWFGDIRSEEQREDDWIRLTTEVKFKAADPLQFRQRIRAGFNLHEFGDRLRLVIEGDNGDAFENGQQIADVPEIDDFIRQTNRDGGSAAIRYKIFSDRYTQLTTDAGVRLSGGDINPFVRIRGSHWFQLSELWSLEPSQVIFQERNEGFGGRSRLDLNRFVDRNSFIRFRLEGYRSEESRGLESLGELSYQARLPGDRLMATSLAALGYSEPVNTVDKYRVSVRYRKPLIKHWLYGTIEPGIEFPNERDFTSTPFVIFRLEALFTRQDAEDDSSLLIPK